MISFLFLFDRYGTSETMYKYGICLSNFPQNHPYVNNSVLTMMYHVAGECKCPETLLQESILNSFLQIMDSQLNVCEVRFNGESKFLRFKKMISLHVHHKQKSFDVFLHTWNSFKRHIAPKLTFFFVKRNSLLLNVVDPELTITFNKIVHRDIFENVNFGFAGNHGFDGIYSFLFHWEGKDWSLHLHT